MAEEQLLASIQADISSLRREVGEATRLIQDMGEKTHATNKRMELSFISLGQAAKAFGVSLSGVQLTNFLRESVMVATSMESLRRSFAAAAGDAQKGAAQFAFVRAESERLGLEFVSAGNAYKGIVAAVAAGGRPLEQAQVLFRGIAEASTAMGLSVQQTEGTLLAVQQIMSKGKVTAEELRQQLGERFPVAIGLMAKTLGVTTQQLDEMMEQGRLTADAMVLLAQAASKQFGPQATEAAKQALAEFNRFKNAVTELQQAIGTALLPDVVNLTKELTALIKGVGSPQNQEAWNLFIGILRSTATEFRTLLDLAKQVGTVLGQVSTSMSTSALRSQMATKYEEARQLQKQLTEGTGGFLGFGKTPLAPEQAEEVGERLARTQQEIIDLQKQYQKAWEGTTAVTTQAAVATEDLTKKVGTLTPVIEDQTKKKQAQREGLQEEERLRKEAFQLTMDRGRAQLQMAEEHERAEEEMRRASLDNIHVIGTAQLAVFDERVQAQTAFELDVQKLTLTTTEFELAEFDRRLAGYEAMGVDMQELAALRERFIARQAEAASEKQRQEQERALEKQAREWEHFAERVSDTISDTIFDVLTGKIDDVEDLFDRLKDAFLRMLSDMAAQAITHQIVLPIVTQVVGGAGMGTQGGVAGALGTSQQALGLFGTANRSQFSNFMAGQPSNLQGPTPSGEPLGWTGTGAAAGGFATAAGGAVAGVGTGFATGMLLQSFNTDVLGLPRDNSAGGRASRALAGAGGGAAGGAIIGSAILPGIGTAVGAIAGAIIGGLVGGLSKVATVPFLQFKAVDLMVGLQDEALTLVENNVVAAGKGLPGSMAEVSDRMETGFAQAFQPVFSFLNTVSPRIRAGVVGPMNQFADDLESLLEGPAYQVAKKQGTEFVQKFLAEEIPRLIGETFGPLVKALEQVQPLIEGYRTAITTLRAQQERLLGSLSAQRVALQETLMTPAQLFERRRSELGSLLGRFRGAGGAEQLQLVPQIQALIGEVMQRGQAAEVLGTDRQALFDLQRELIGYVDELTAVSTQVLDTQMSQAQHQIDVLEESLLHLESVDTAAAASRLLLQDLNTFLQTAFQGQFQGGGYIGHTGFALVHAGEHVLPAGPIHVNLTVNSAAPHSAGLTADIERMVITKVIPVLKQRQRLGQF